MFIFGVTGWGRCRSQRPCLCLYMMFLENRDWFGIYGERGVIKSTEQEDSDAKTTLSRLWVIVMYGMIIY